MSHQSCFSSQFYLRLQSAKWLAPLGGVEQLGSRSVGSTVAAQTGLLAAWRLENTTSSHPQQSRLESTVSYLSSIDLLIAIIIFEALQLLSVEKSINHLEVSYLELKCRISFYIILLYFYRNHNQQKFDALHTFVYCHV